jgi:hypothetical protein
MSSSSKDIWGMFLFVSPHSLAHDEVGARKYQTKSSSPSTLCRLLHKKHILYYHMAALSKHTQGTPLSRRIEELLSPSPERSIVSGRRACQNLVCCKIQGGCKRFQRGAAPFSMAKPEGFYWVVTLQNRCGNRL